MRLAICFVSKAGIEIIKGPVYFLGGKMLADVRLATLTKAAAPADLINTGRLGRVDIISSPQRNTCFKKRNDFRNYNPLLPIHVARIEPLVNYPKLSSSTITIIRSGPTRLDA